ncbi:hypothetical protein [Ketobacter alkanivorans]|uniref:Uncharacterized protein n=1 Tax=Ketobacter alkanivorans TaxID=1917421 RepID=A0A2K9LML3_9GAMM|nr:hypothetical protein [Ketobacter alkanivorans]AUM13578.1 hypothetical protein Kalk_14615 [Ketobacter alkanivorans]
MDESILESIKFLKSKKSFQERKQRQLEKSNPNAAARHAESAEGFAKIISWFEECLANPPKRPVSSDDVEGLFSLNPLDIDDLPEDFREEISITEGDKQDAQIIELMRIANRPLDLNEILIACWRKYNVQHKRNQLTARLYRLSKRGEIHPVNKGTYALGAGPESGQEDEAQEQLI